MNVRRLVLKSNKSFTDSRHSRALFAIEKETPEFGFLSGCLNPECIFLYLSVVWETWVSIYLFKQYFNSFAYILSQIMLSLNALCLFLSDLCVFT